MYVFSQALLTHNSGNHAHIVCCLQSWPKANHILKISTASQATISAFSQLECCIQRRK